MAREYPRFLFSNPQNTKSKGPFIVHSLKPKLIIKVSDTIIDDDLKYLRIKSISAPFKYFYAVGYLEDDAKLSDLVETNHVFNNLREDVISILTDASVWFSKQIKTGEIKL